MQLMDKDKAKMLLDTAKLLEKARADIVQFVKQYEQGKCKELNNLCYTYSSTDLVDLGVIVEIKEKV